MNYHRLSRQGFTLVELSIVLVIIGLLIGGILIGQSLIDSARLTTQIHQIQQYEIAANNFKGKYKCLPGSRPGSFSGATCNVVGGVGGHQLQMWYYGSWFFPDLHKFGLLSERYEYIHSIPAGVGIGGNYPEPAMTGRRVMNTCCGLTSYAARLPLTDSTRQLWWSFDGESGNHQADWSWDVSSPFTPVEAASLDSKLDDGLPLSGNVLAVQPGSVNSPLVPNFHNAVSLASVSGNSACVDGSSYNVNSKVIGLNGSIWSSGRANSRFFCGLIVKAGVY